MVDILIGRAQPCHYRVSDPTVSRRHATLTYKSKDDLVCADLSSRNGTYVLRKREWIRIEGEMALRRTDQLRLGAAKVFVADIIADARLPDLAETGDASHEASDAAGEVVQPRREHQRPRRNILTGEVEES